MVWSANSIKQLRRQLGWGPAHLARRLGCKVEDVAAWEVGTSVPNADTTSQLMYLKSFVEKNAYVLSSKPIAESLMKDKGLEQISQDELSDLED